DVDPECLEGAPSRMLAPRTGRIGRGDHLRQALRRVDGSLLTLLDDATGDAAAMTLFAVAEDDGCQVLEGVVVDHVGGALALCRHAHVEWPVVPEGEAALALVDLH